MDPYEKQLLWDHLAHLKGRIDAIEKALGVISTIGGAVVVALVVVIFKNHLW